MCIYIFHYEFRLYICTTDILVILVQINYAKRHNSMCIGEPHEPPYSSFTVAKL